MPSPTIWSDSHPKFCFHLNSAMILVPTGIPRNRQLLIHTRLNASSACQGIHLDVGVPGPTNFSGQPQRKASSRVICVRSTKFLGAPSAPTSNENVAVKSAFVEYTS